MIARIGRSGLVILTVIALIALVGVAAGCGGDEETTTTVDEPPRPPPPKARPRPPRANRPSPPPPSPTPPSWKAARRLERVRGGDTRSGESRRGRPRPISTRSRSLAVAHYQLGEYEQAEAAYQKILAHPGRRLHPQQPGQRLPRLGEDRRGEGGLPKGHRRRPDPEVSVRQPSRASSSKQGDTTGALEVLERGLRST